MVVDSLREQVKETLLQTSVGFRLDLRRRYGARVPKGQPDAPWHNAVLQDQDESQRALAQVKTLGLHPHKDTPKNWDSLAALDVVLKTTPKETPVLDAGAELYSRILHWLFLYGYRNLHGINLVFRSPIRRGTIVYDYGDITKTRFADETFGAITCLSVVEHGVNLEAYYREMARIIRKGGVLVTSTDYWDSPVDTLGKTAYGVPIHIFSERELADAIRLARNCGFEPVGPLRPATKARVVRWPEHDLTYTFAVFTLRKRDR